MYLKDQLPVFEALANEKRLEIFEYINEHLFVPKTELIIKFDLNRAALNHHLKYLLSARIISEQELLIDGHKHTFLVPNVMISLETFIVNRTDIKRLKEIFDSLINQNMTFNKWQLIRASLLEDSLISSTLMQALEIYFFKDFQNVDDNTICWVCLEKKALLLCQKCLRPTCSNCNHEIYQENKLLNYCRSCIESIFG